MLPFRSRSLGKHSFQTVVPEARANEECRDGDKDHRLLAPCQKEHPVRIIRRTDPASIVREMGFEWSAVKGFS